MEEKLQTNSAFIYSSILYRVINDTGGNRGASSQPCGKRKGSPHLRYSGIVKRSPTLFGTGYPKRSPVYARIVSWRRSEVERPLYVNLSLMRAGAVSGTTLGPKFVTIAQRSNGEAASQFYSKSREIKNKGQQLTGEG